MAEQYRAADVAQMSPEALAQASANALFERDIAAQDMGIDIVSVGPGRAELSMTVQNRMLNGHATCHGGYLFALADTAFAYACNSRNQNTVAGGCSIEYLAPGREGDRLTAVAEERSLAGRTGCYDISIYNQDETLLALFRGKSYKIRGAVIAGSDAE
ncbi:hydroxyphenylacetyl-CoA thioesterase PaaI [Pseudoteredinibacter isoporae]|uniref:hydroxyphenylacetyl-CoA thioesterase PaaI n=1 Tax=Pseudoteredinibacter isoporae TaxID=570281 RepID=UPI003104AA85